MLGETSAGRGVLTAFAAHAADLLRNCYAQTPSTEKPERRPCPGASGSADTGWAVCNPTAAGRQERSQWLLPTVCGGKADA